MSVRAKTAEDKRWQAEEDLAAIARAREAEKDKARMKAVEGLAKERLREEQSKLDAIKSVIGGADGKGSKEKPAAAPKGKKLGVPPAAGKGAAAKAPSKQKKRR